MPLLPNIIERLLFFRMNKGPGPIFDWVGALGFKAVVVALRLGVFDAIGHGKVTAADLARRLALDEHHLGLLLDALETFGYLTKKRGRYSSSPATLTWLLSSSPSTIADLFPQADDMMRRWDQLDETIRHGRPPVLGAQMLSTDPGGWDRYHRGLRACARLVSAEVVAKLDVPRHARSILDIGGSHGLFSVELCRRHRQLNATIFDWPQAAEIAGETIREAGMNGRVRFVAGDFMVDEPGDGFDVALLFNVIRIFPALKLSELFSRVSRWLARDGALVVLDQLNDRPISRFLRANARLIELELINSTAGEIHRSEDVARLFRESGFRKIKQVSIVRSPGLGLVIGRK
jgi:SAM-dependent methyltransferase